MFLDTSMTALNQRRNRKRAWLLTCSVALHGLALASFAGAQMWRIEAIGEPPTNDVFQVMLPPPVEAGAPAPPPRHAEAPRQPQAPPAPRTAPPTLAQPDPAVTPPRAPQPPVDTVSLADRPPMATDPVDTAPSDVGPFIGKGARRIGDGWTQGPDLGDDRALPIGGPISRPQIVPGTKVQPHYTELARQARLQGVVLLEATIDERGNVVDVHVLKGLRMGLDDEAVKAVSQWKYTPALLHGRPVKVYFDLTVQFEVR
jgi:periplasmic protein TonB